MRKRIIVQVIEDLYNYHNQLIAKLQQEFQSINGGPLSILYNHYLYETTNTGKVGITKDKDRTRQLIRKDYLDHKIKELQQDRNALEKILPKLGRESEADSYLKTRFEDTPFGYLESLISEHQYHCNLEPSLNSMHPENLNTYTNAGKTVRTFSEKLWADLYESLNIPYWYEMKLTIDVTDMPSVRGAYPVGDCMYKDYYPDFAIPLADGTWFIHEHLGLIDRDDYIYKVGEKIIAYTNGLGIPMDHIIFTYPKDVRDQRQMKEFLEKNVVPYI